MMISNAQLDRLIAELGSIRSPKGEVREVEDMTGLYCPLAPLDVCAVSLENGRLQGEFR